MGSKLNNLGRATLKGLSLSRFTFSPLDVPVAIAQKLNLGGKFRDLTDKDPNLKKLRTGTHTESVNFSGFENTEFKTRTPEEIEAILDLLENSNGQIEALGRLTYAGRAIAKPVRNHLSEILSSVGLQELPLIDKIDQKLPIWDLENFLEGSKYLAQAIFFAYAAKHGADSEFWLANSMHEISNQVPELWSRIIGISEGLVPTKSVNADTNQSLTILFASLNTLMLFVRGAIPWRGDQINLKKTWKSERDQETEDGTRPYGALTDTNSKVKAGQTILFGPNGRLMESENKAGKSTLRQIREEKKTELVPMFNQIKDHHQPENLGIYFNEEDLVIDVSKFFGDSDQIVTAIGHIIASGAIKARRIVVNGFREYELFQKNFVDAEDGTAPHIDFDMIQYFILNLLTIREIICKESPDLDLHLIIPQRLGQTPNGRKDDVYKDVLAGFEKISKLSEGTLKLAKVIVPEKLFIGDVKRRINAKKIEDPKIYIDSKKTTDADEKSEGCLESLTSAGLCVVDNIEEANVVVMLRTRSKSVEGTTEAVVSQYKQLKLVIYTQDSRYDSVSHSERGQRQASKIQAAVGAQLVQNIKSE